MKIIFNHKQEPVLMDDDIFKKYALTSEGVYTRSIKGKIHVRLKIDGKEQVLWRVICNNFDPNYRMRYKNGNSFDCRRNNFNLRTMQEDQRYMKNFQNKYKGVSENKANKKSKWGLWFIVNGKKLCFKMLKTQEEAGQKYDAIHDYLKIDGYRNFPDRTFVLNKKDKDIVDNKIIKAFYGKEV
jgi:hypothetical protein